jgi:hypothetical protein
MRIHLKARARTGHMVIFASGDLGLIVGLSLRTEADRVSSELVNEKLDFYSVELGFVAWLAAFLDDASNWSAQPGADRTT